MGVKDNKESVKGYLKYSMFAIQMGVTIYLGALAGKKLDAVYPMEKKWFTMLFVILSVTLSLFVLLRQLNKENSKNNEKNEN
jgi:membrane protein DedA with SNARE-associated domain